MFGFCVVCLPQLA